MAATARIIAPAKHPGDLSVDVLDSVPGKCLKSVACCDFSSIIDHPQLTDADKAALCWLICQSPYGSSVVTPPHCPGLSEEHDAPEWVRCTGMMGIQVSRQDPEPPERVYKMRGITEVAASTEVIYDMVTEFEQMQKWDAMLQHMDIIERGPRQYPITRVGTFINTYGVPGLSWLFHDRQFFCRGVAMHFADGTRALACYSPPEPHDSDPGVLKPRTIRAHMGVSGYVVSPFAGEERRHLGPDRCQITMVLQVDPKGGVPLPVYNACSMMMPMNLHRVKLAAAKLKPAEAEEIKQRQQNNLTASKALAAAAAGAGVIGTAVQE